MGNGHHSALAASSAAVDRLTGISSQVGETGAAGHVAHDRRVKHPFEDRELAVLGWMRATMRMTTRVGPTVMA